jgi:hypothetical protein
MTFFFLSLPLTTSAESFSGIQPLRYLQAQKIYSFLKEKSIRPLLTPQEKEDFLRELENAPPDWNQMHDLPSQEYGARLFDLNRQRDELRKEHPLLYQRLAFFWDGILIEFDDEHQGYKVVIGPAPTQTTWGIVRFKPIGFPNEMVSKPPPRLLQVIQNRIGQGQAEEIRVLFTGTLIQWESIIYAFSHDGLQQGMVMPVVQVDGVQYFSQNQQN